MRNLSTRRNMRDSRYGGLDLQGPLSGYNQLPTKWMQSVWSATKRVIALSPVTFYGSIAQSGERLAFEN